VTNHKQVVETYIEGFRRSDHAMILGCVTDDVIWDLKGYKWLQGRDAFDAEIENDATPGPPTLTIDRMIEEGDTVVAIGNGEGSLRDGGRFYFTFCDVFTFEGEKIGRLETYQVNLQGSFESS
jgi:uncharacterized protein